jgi:hypothetical protein
MKFNNFIQENTDISVEAARQMIFDDCNPFRQLAGAHNLYRGKKGPLLIKHGTKDYMIQTIKTIYPRNDRKPTDTPVEYHELLDDKFESKFGWRARSEGVFATSDYGQATAYGHVYLFFPIGSFKFIWSPKIRDLYMEIDEIADDVRSVGEDEDVIRKAVIIGIDHMAKTYTDSSLKMAVKSGHEIMFKCNSYYLVNEYWILNGEKYEKVFG